MGKKIWFREEQEAQDVIDDEDDEDEDGCRQEEATMTRPKIFRLPKSILLTQSNVLWHVLINH